MNRSQRRLSERGRDKIMQQAIPMGAGKFELITSMENRPKWMSRAFKNNWYFVYIDDNAMTSAGKAIKALIQKIDDTPIKNHWSEMQKIKNEIFGSETTAIEYYPKESQLVNSHNIYWLWIYPEGIIPVPCVR